jgi:signal transduction histidine kinase
MIEQLLEVPALGWPVALTCASVVAAERVRSSARRTRLNRALHELRRPLQALVLGAPRGHVDLAVEALAELDREINGGTAPAATPVAAHLLVTEAVARWRPIAARTGRRIGLTWRANGSRVVCRPGAITAALDNLISNALEHGTGPVQVDARAVDGRLRLRVANAAGRPRPRRRRDPRRGHGLRVVARIAAEHGGRFATCRHGGGASAVLELPLAGSLPPAA